jgi:hypothetical protein
MVEQPRKAGVYGREGDTTTARSGGVPSWVWIAVAVVIVALLAWWFLGSKPSNTASTMAPAGQTTGQATGGQSTGQPAAKP